MKRYFIFLFILFFTLPAMTQIRVDLNRKINREANRRANRQADKAVDKSFDKVEEGIGDIFKKKEDKPTSDQKNESKETSEQHGAAAFGPFTSLFPAKGDVASMPLRCTWEIPNKASYKFTVYLEGDDWTDWLMFTTHDNEMIFSSLPTETKNLSWQVVAEGNGQRLESPWQIFTLSDKTDGASKPAKPDVQWSKFDFVPGDEVIFEDGPGQDEENGEFPSRWDLVKGQVEIASVNGENVMMFIDGAPTIVPYLNNSKEDYLPDVFTIEFDFYKPENGNRISVYLFDDKNQSNVNSSMYMDIGSGKVTEKLSDISGSMPGIDYSNNSKARWIHISIAFTKGKLKVYMDDTRVINIPHYEGNPSGLTLQAYWADLGEDLPFYFKNIRIAKGGVKYYDRVLSDGKIIVNGIRFDVNKATIKPESNGAINEIFALMQKQPDLNFSVEGHTDSDGNDALNQTLSENRAKAVMERLIDMGIAANRLKSAGWGESKPIGENATSEGKANNRRVEFVKF